MNTVICCGFSDEIRPFCAALSHYGRVQCFMHRQKICYPAERDTVFTVIGTDSLPQTENATGILLLGSALRKNEPVPGAGMIPIFEADNRTAAELLRRSDCAAISYGTAAQDTVSVSGYTASGVSLSLQRTVRTLSGRRIEEREICLPFYPKGSPYLAAALGTVLLLCDREI